MQKSVFELRTWIFLALLAALGAVFSAFLSIELAPAGMKTIEISLTPVPVMLAGMLFGPIAGGLVGFVADTAGFFMGVQHGAYNPLFSVTMALFGIIAGLFYLKSKQNNIWKTTGAVTAAQVVCSVILNTMLIWLFYGEYIGVSFGALIGTRAIGALIELPLYAWILMMLAAALKPLLSQGRRKPAAT